ncbi:hypothetical protein WA171_000382 [Blastocystis sp. BT1]
MREAFATLDEKKMKTCGILANLYSIVVTLDALESSYNQGCIADEIHNTRKKSLNDQFKGCMKAASGIISEEQFFKELYSYKILIYSYFPNGEYAQGVSILQDVDGQIQKLRDEATEAFYNLNVTLQKIRTKKRIADAIEELHQKIVKCVSFAHLSFNCENDIEQMTSILDEDDCEDDSNIQNPNVIASITNIMDDLQQRFKELHFSSVY